jgi:hypothetical protein
MERRSRVQGSLDRGTSELVATPTFERMAGARRFLMLFALAGVVAVLGACGGGGASLSAEPLSLAQLTSAAETSAEASSGRFEFSMDMALPGAPGAFAFSGDGAFDTTNDRASLSFDLSSLAGLLGGLAAGLGGADAPDFSDPAAWKIDAVTDGKVVYLKFPVIADQLPEGKSWVRVDPSATGTAAGFDLSELEQFTSNDPRSLLDFLKAVSGEIETVGTEELRGVATTHYRATIDLRNYEQLVPPADREELRTMLGDLVEQSGLAEMPFDVWLDESGLVRKVELTFSASPSGTADALDASVSFELFDYGADVDIAVPAADEVVDASALSG